MISPFHFFNHLGSIVIYIILIVFILNFWKTKVLINKSFIRVSIFLLIIINTYSLIPYMYCFSSYLWNRMLISLILLRFIYVAKIFKNLDKFIAHLLPLKSPILLWDLLIVLETISHLIRPITLSLRLTCNLLTGHVLIRLTIVRQFTPILIALLSFEFIIRVVQAHVFNLLVKSYYLE